MEKRKIQKPSFLQEWKVPLTFAVATTGYCFYNPKAVKESLEYIKEIPTPLKVLLSIIGGYSIFKIFQNTKKINHLERKIIENKNELEDFKKKFQSESSSSVSIMTFNVLRNRVHNLENKVTIIDNSTTINLKGLDIKMNALCLQLAQNIGELNQEITLARQYLHDIAKRQHKLSFFSDIYKELVDTTQYEALMQEVEQDQKKKEEEKMTAAQIGNFYFSPAEQHPGLVWHE